MVRSVEDHRSPAGPSPSPITRSEGSLCWCMVLTRAAPDLPFLLPWTLAPTEPPFSHTSGGTQAAASAPSEVTRLQPSSTCPQSLSDPPAVPVSLSSLGRSPALRAAPCLGCPPRLCPIMAVGSLDYPVFYPGSLKTAYHYLEGCKNKVQAH